jgi:hypothetical protein
MVLKLFPQSYTRPADVKSTICTCIEFPPGRRMPAPKKISCSQCRMAKTRCSLALPYCSRCLQRGLACNYGDARHGQKSVNLPQNSAKQSSGGRVVRSTQSVEPTPERLQRKTTLSRSNPESIIYDQFVLPDEVDSETISTSVNWFATASVQPNSAIDACTKSTSNLLFTSQQTDTPVSPSWFEPLVCGASNPRSLHLWNETTNLTDFIPGNAEQSPFVVEPASMQGSRFSSLDASFMWSLHKESPRKYPGVLQRTKQFGSGHLLVAKYLHGTISAFPQMLLNSSTLPCFIHHRAAHEFERGGTRQLRRPLANCASLVHMFQGKTAASSPFVWSTIFSEQRRLYTEASSVYTSRMPL